MPFAGGKDQGAVAVVIDLVDARPCGDECRHGRQLALARGDVQRGPAFVVGMVHIKDVLACVAKQKPFQMSDIVRDVVIVAPSMPVLDLLLQMRQSRQHMALVVDEFGGIDGLVTIEDLVEEIVGEIEDEHDEEEAPMLNLLDDGVWEADARVELDELARVVDPRLTWEEDEVDTLGGLVFLLAGHIPAKGECVEHPSGWKLEAVDSDPRKILRVRLHAPDVHAQGR